MDEDGDRIEMTWGELANFYQSERDVARAERDAAIRERDALRAARITQALTADRFAAAVQEADALRARVEELEARTSTPGEGCCAAPAASGGGTWHCARTSPPLIGEFKLCRWVTTVCGNRQVSYGEGARRPDGMWGRSNRVETIPPEQWQDLPAGPGVGRERWELEAASGGNSTAQPYGSQAASGGGGLTPHQWSVVLELHDAASAFRDSSAHRHQVRLDQAIAAAERLLTQQRPAVPSSGGGEGEGTFFVAGGPFNFQYAEDSFFPPNVHGFLRQCVKIKEAPPQPRGWLTEEEREVLAFVLFEAKRTYHKKYDGVIKAVESLLARSSPPEVVLPGSGATDEWLPDFTRGCGVGRNKCIDQVRAALAAAGVAVKEVGSE
jgi:hypothetical protein